MKNLIKLKVSFFLIVCFLHSCSSQSNFSNEIRFEQSNGNETATYHEAIHFYEEAASFSKNATLTKYGNTDHGEPLHVFTLEGKKNSKKPLKILILNGIHPGEPDGIDASMLLIKKILNNEFKLPNSIQLHIIPVYNVGGALNRNSTTRVNQNGPSAYGFRGNASNFDLNRDFIKTDTKNAATFHQIYHKINPDVFIDTHVSNGADYQYTLTHLFTQPQQIGGKLGTFIAQDFIPSLEDNLKNKNHMITPYVNVFNRTPKQGFTQFLDTPRYSTGYTSLWNSLGLMIETHMLKSYSKRVEATLAMLESLILLSAEKAEAIQTKRQENFEDLLGKNEYKFNFKVDSTQYKELTFLGYDAEVIESEVTGQKRLKYNNQKPVTYKLPYYNVYKASNSVKIPRAYIIPKSNQAVINLLQQNHIKMTSFKQDSLIDVEVYHIKDYQTRNSAYEGHYLHYNTQVNTSTEKVLVQEGDYLVETQQNGIRYLLETLEPEAVDSFFNWNFFDAILQRKEGFSPYVFEDLAIQILEKNPELKTEFENKKLNDKSFAENGYEQLNWIYKHSKYYEKAYLRYPIYRIL